MPYVILYGSLGDGFTPVGPFDDFDDANEYIDGEPSMRNLQYEIMELIPPAAHMDDHEEETE